MSDVCNICAAVVEDTTLHDQFHANLGMAINLLNKQTQDAIRMADRADSWTRPIGN